MGYDEESSKEVIFGDGKIENVTNSYANTIDGDKDTFNKVTKDEDIVYNLGNLHYVDKAQFTFEKPGLGLKYVVYAEDNDGNRTLLPYCLKIVRLMFRYTEVQQKSSLNILVIMVKVMHI